MSYLACKLNLFVQKKCDFGETPAFLDVVHFIFDEAASLFFNSV